MAKVIEATENGPGLFNALSIALGIEILSGRLDNHKDSPGYKRLLDEFESHHPNFKPKSWENLKQWLAFYNSSKDMEVILAPVLFHLNQQYQELLETQIHEQLFNLIWVNRAQVENDSPWWELTTHDDADNILFPRLDKLAPEIKADLLKQLKNIIQIIIKQCNENSTREDVRDLLKQNSIQLVQDLKIHILNDKTAYLGVYSCSELESMANALNSSLIENGAEDPPGNKTKIRLQTKQYRWIVACEEDDFNQFINQSPQRLKITTFDAFQGKGIVSGPTLQEIEKLNESRIVIRDKMIDNPGLGNCAYYAFAIALIDIIQEEKVSNSKAMYEHWVSLDKTLTDEYEAIGAFDFSNHDNKLLDKLQSSLRRIAYNFQLDELKKACVKATLADDLEAKYPEKESLPYKNALKYKYKDITANTNYLNFAALYFGKAEDIDPRFNPFANSAAVTKAIKELDRKKIEDTYEELTLVPLFLKLIYGEEQAAKPITETTEPEVSSSIIEGIKNIIKQFFWGLHQDLSDLATRFKVNLHTLENGINLRNESHGDIATQHTVTVNNVGNYHWTTQIKMTKEEPGFNFGKVDAASLNDTQKVLDSDPLKEQIVEPLQEKDVELLKVNEAEPLKVNDAEPLKENDAEPLKANDAEPLKANDAEPLKANDAEPLKANDAEPLKANDAEPLTNNVKVNEPEKVEVVAVVPKSHSDLISLLVPKKSSIRELDEKSELSSKPDNGQKKVKFTLSHSQIELEDQRKRNLKILDQANAQVSEKPVDPVHTEKLIRLRRAVSNATIAYTGYSDSIWFSLFHRHGNTGRVRAKAFNTQFSEIDNYTEAKEQLIRYLNNNNGNGNTHPHSFRTMLLHEMLKDNPKPTLQYTSDHFEEMLAELSSVLNVRLSAPMHQW